MAGLRHEGPTIRPAVGSRRSGNHAAPWQTRPFLFLNPRDDVVFARAAWAGLLGGAITPDRLQAVLRARYPTAVVRERALSEEPFLVWYVYRDGHWIRSASDRGSRPQR